MSYRVTLLNATGALSSVADYLYEQLNSLSLQLADHFELNNIDVTISPFGHGDVPQSGIGGYCLSPYRVEVLLDTQRTDIKPSLKTNWLQCSRMNCIICFGCEREKMGSLLERC